MTIEELQSLEVGDIVVWALFKSDLYLITNIKLRDWDRNIVYVSLQQLSTNYIYADGQINLSCILVEKESCKFNIDGSILSKQ